jgi:hypothetical protein
MAGTGFAALLLGSIVAPAISARESAADRSPMRFSGAPIAPLGSFTPATADPRLAALIARTGMSTTGFRFTPATESIDRRKPVTVAVRARSNRLPGLSERTAAAAPSGVSLAPIAYDLGVSVGWKRFAVSGAVTHIDMASAPGSQERVDLGLGYRGKRASAGVNASASRPLTDVPPAISDLPSYSVDLTSSYSLTRNLDVTAGVRYKAERDRLPQIQDNRRDSQAVYVGTAFRF